MAEDATDGGGLDVLERQRREAQRQEPPIIEMFNMFPHESGIVMRRGVELGMICRYISAQVQSQQALFFSVPSSSPIALISSRSTGQQKV